MYKCNDLIQIYLVKWLPRWRKLTHPSPHIINAVNFVCVSAHAHAHDECLRAPLANVQMCNTALLTIVTCCTLAPQNLIFLNWKSVPFVPITLLTTPLTPGGIQHVFSVSTKPFCLFVFKESTCKWYYTVFAFLSGIFHWAQCSPGSSILLQMAEFSSFILSE